MPLEPGSSPATISRNISELTHHGSRPRSHEQIVAIALSNADRHPHRADGGIGSDTLDRMEKSQDLGYAERQKADQAGLTQAIIDKYRLGPTGYRDAASYADDLRTFENSREMEGRAAGGIAAPFHLMPPPNAMPHVAQPMSPSQGSPWWSRSAAREMERAPRGLAEGGGLGMAAGGVMSASEGSPWWERSEARAIEDVPFHSGGFLGGSGAGRTDRLPLAVGAESHVLPADTVSGAGQDSSKFGASALMAALSTGPWGVHVPRAVHASTIPHPPSVPHAETGLAQGGTPHGQTSILAADGEIVVPPDIVEDLGRRGLAQGMGKKGETAIECGHRLLDEMIHRVRAFHIEWLKSAPAPKR